MSKSIKKLIAIVLTITLGVSGVINSIPLNVFANINKTTETVITNNNTESETTVKDNIKESTSDNKSIKDNQITPTLYSLGTVNIHKTNANKANRFELFGVKPTGEDYKTLKQFNGMKFYSHGIKNTDEKGNLTFNNLSLDEDEWYFIKDLSNDNIINVGSLPYYFDKKPIDGRIEKKNGQYILYDINFEITNTKADITNLPEKEDDTIMPLLFTTNVTESSIQANDKYKWNYNLYSDVEPRKTTLITGKAEFLHGSGTNRTLASIFNVSGVFASCAQHNKSTTLAGTKINEKKYTGNNARNIRKLLYYGYGGYDKGQTFIKAYKGKVNASLLAFATIISTSYYYCGQSCWDSWDVMQILRNVAKNEKDPETLATAATKIQFKNASGNNIATNKAHLAKNDKDYSNNNFYYSNWITINSNGKKNITFSTKDGVSVYKKSGNNITGPVKIENINVKNGEKLKFRFNKDIIKSGTKVKVKMQSEGGIVDLYAIVGIAPETKQDSMREYISTHERVTDTLKFTMPTEYTETSTPPTYSNIYMDDTIIHTINVIKKDGQTSELLKDATIEVKNSDGVKKTIITNDKGAGSVTFSYHFKTKNYLYLTNTNKLTEEQIQNEIDNGFYRNKSDAEKAAKAELNKLINQNKTYTVKEIAAPTNYKINSDVQTIIISGENKKEDVTISDIPEEFNTGVVSYGTYYYQEVDIGKVDSEDTSLVLPGVQFQIYPQNIGNGSKLVKIIYSDENNNINTIENNNGIDATLTTSLDGYTSEDFYLKNAKKGNTVVNAKTNKNGVIRVGYLYKLQATNGYNYIKDYDSLNNSQKQEADKLIANGYYKNESDALESAKREIKEKINEISNTYHAWENPININNPYDNKEYWNLDDYISYTLTSLLAKDAIITKYAEIEPGDMETIFNKKKDITAYDTNTFVSNISEQINN